MIDSFFDSLPQYIELLMGYIPLLILIAVPIALFRAYSKTQKETKTARDSARMLGLSYVNVAEEMKKDNQSDSFISGLLSSWSPWAMKGEFNGVTMIVELIVKGKQQRYIPHFDRVNVSNPVKTSYSRGVDYFAGFDTPLPFDIIIRKNIDSPLGSFHNRGNDAIKTGDEEFDQLLFISSNKQQAVQEWLNVEQRRDALKELYAALPMVNINSDGLRFHDLNNKADYDHLKNNLTKLTKAVQKLQE